MKITAEQKAMAASYARSVLNPNDKAFGKKA
jgi:hypothetical protein